MAASHPCCLRLCKPLPRNTCQNPKKRFYETNRNPPRPNRAAREQPEGLRPSGSNTTSPTFQHPPIAPQARPVRRLPQRVSRRPRAAAASQPCPPRPPQRVSHRACAMAASHPCCLRLCKPLPRKTCQSPKKRFYETNRNPPRPNRAAREQPEGLRPSGSNTTSPTFQHPPLAPQARPVRRLPQRVSRRPRAAAASHLCPLPLCKPLPRNTCQNPKKRFYETNRNPPQPASARAQPPRFRPRAQAPAGPQGG
ncbi:MAG: hypothetical protein KatS3mg005_0864 [Bryobacteraceae bacterium]|nr:MAG: hypothetical protein KatS3mg005_0864 [Bryobacteraceae bacterium]